MDILTHIKEEHEKFKSSMQEIESHDGSKKKGLFREFYAELYGHHEAEEHVLFALVKERLEEKNKDVILEMIEEHNLATYQFSLLERTSVENETWDAKFSVLKEVLEHHMDEEEKEFMPLARKVLTSQELEILLEKFELMLEEKKKEKQKEIN